MQMRTDIAARAVERVPSRLSHREDEMSETRGPERATEPEPPAEPMPEVEEAFEEIEVDAPLVGIIMGSKNDKPKMQPAGEALHERGHQLRGAGDERPPRPRAGRASTATTRACAG